MNELTIAFVMDCDSRGLTYEQGLNAADSLAEEIVAAAEDRIAYVEPASSGQVEGAG